MITLDEMAVLLKQVVFTVRGLTPPHDEEDADTSSWVMFIDGDNSPHEIAPADGKRMTVGKQYIAICIFKDRRIQQIISMAEWMGKNGALEKVGEQMDISPSFWNMLLTAGFVVLEK